MTFLPELKMTFFKLDSASLVLKFPQYPYRVFGNRCLARFRALGWFPISTARNFSLNTYKLIMGKAGCSSLSYVNLRYLKLS